MPNLEARLDRLEQEVARTRRSSLRWRSACLAAVLVGAFPYLVGAAVQDEEEVAKVLRTERLAIVDGNGNTRLELDTDEDGGLISLLNNANNNALTVAADADGAGLVLVRSPQGQNGAVLNADENGGIVAALAADGTPKVTLESDSGHGLISVYNADGVKVVEAASQASTGDGYYAAWNVQDDLSLILPESVSPQEESAPAEAEAPFNTK